MVEASTPCVHDSFEYDLLAHGCIHVRIQKIYSKNKCIAGQAPRSKAISSNGATLRLIMLATGVSTPGVIF